MIGRATMFAKCAVHGVAEGVARTVSDYIRYRRLMRAMDRVLANLGSRAPAEVEAAQKYVDDVGRTWRH